MWRGSHPHYGCRRQKDKHIRPRVGGGKTRLAKAGMGGANRFKLERRSAPNYKGKTKRVVSWGRSGGGGNNKSKVSEGATQTSGKNETHRSESPAALKIGSRAVP